MKHNLLFSALIWLPRRRTGQHTRMAQSHIWRLLKTSRQTDLFYCGEEWDYSAFISGYLIRKCNPLARMWTNRHTQRTDNVHTLSASSFKPAVSPLCFVTGWIVWDQMFGMVTDKLMLTIKRNAIVSSCPWAHVDLVHKVSCTKWCKRKSWRNIYILKRKSSKMSWFSGFLVCERAALYDKQIIIM